MNKSLILSVVFALLPSVVTYGQTNFYERVSQLWLAGQKQEVRNIGLQRLQVNSNDIAGLILKLEYESEYLDLTNIINTATRILEVGASISSTNFMESYRFYPTTYKIMQRVLTNYPQDQIESDRAKASITNKPLAFGYMIKALQDDGYFTVVLLQAQLRLKPEALEVSPGILTAFVRLPEGYPVSGITSATCDGAQPERMMSNDDGSEMIIKFRRQDIEKALAQTGQSLDTSFVVRGTWQGAAGTYPFQGTASIKKIIGPKK